MSKASAWRGRHTIAAAVMGALCLLLACLSLPAVAAASGGTISGTITAAATGLPLEEATACAYEPWTEGFCDEADAAGHYQIADVPPGTYTVAFQKYESDLLIQYFDHTNEYWEAEHFTVTDGSSRSGVDAALEEGGTITGTVTDEADGEPIAGFEVCVTRTDSGSFSACERSDEDGAYTIKRLYPAQYKVHFVGGEKEVGPGESEPFNYVPEYYDDKASWIGSASVPITVGSVASGIDAQLQEGAEVAGSVTYADSGEPAEEIQVCAYTAAKGSEAACRDTDSDGDYLIPGLEPGEYKLGFFPGWSSPYARQYYDEEDRLAAADLLTLTAGALTSGVDAALIEAGKISGTVTAAAGGAPIEGLNVCAFDENEMQGASCGQTDAGGKYTIEGVEAGEYVVQFHGGSNLLGQYYAGAATLAEADRVEVENGATATGVDAQMAAAGRIEGTVTDAAGGEPLPGTEVCAVPSTAAFTWDADCTTAGSDGEYLLGGLDSGSYDVRFTHFVKGPTSSKYMPQWFDAAPSRSGADPVSVTAGSAATGIDAALSHGGRISGTVRDAQTHLGIEGSVCALPVRRNGEAECTQADENGNYLIGGLPTGSYKVRFGPGFSGDMNYLRTFWDGAATRSEAEPIDVTTGETTAGIDADLLRGGKITGTVSDAESEAPVVGARVCVVNYNACAWSDVDGDYALEGLPGGSFKLHFEPGGIDSPYAGVYYHDAATSAAATAIAVSPGQTKGGVDQALHEAGRIAGTVVDAVTDAPLEEIRVCAFTSTGAGACRVTDEAGEYLIQGLPPGDYEVHFKHADSYPPGFNAQYAPQYYDDAASPATATTVSVEDGELEGGIDAAMHEGGTIDGRVTIASSGNPSGGVGVCLIPEDEEEEFEECTLTDGKGEYALEGIADGTYTVSFHPGLYGPYAPPNLMRQYYDGAEDLGSADEITISGASVVHDVDAALEPGGQISGLVTSAADGSPIEGAQACAYEDGGDETLVECASSNGHGEYTISRLPTGSYRVEFSVLGYEWQGAFVEGEESSGSYEEFLTQYYDGSASLGEADPVAVVAGEAVEEIDAEMVEGGDPPWEKPALRSAPQLSGSATTGDPLTCTEGSWRHAPTGYAFRWLRDGDPIAMQASPTYTPQDPDSGHEVACEVTAFNDSGSSIATSNAVRVSAPTVAGQPPATPPAAQAPPLGGKPKPKPKCRKGFRKKLVHGKRRCVKKHRAKHHRQQR